MNTKSVDIPGRCATSNTLAILIALCATPALCQVIVKSCGFASDVVYQAKSRDDAHCDAAPVFDTPNRLEMVTNKLTANLRTEFVCAAENAPSEVSGLIL